MNFFSSLVARFKALFLRFFHKGATTPAPTAVQAPVGPSKVLPVDLPSSTGVQPVLREDLFADQMQSKEEYDLYIRTYGHFPPARPSAPIVGTPGAGAVAHSDDLSGGLPWLKADGLPKWVWDGKVYHTAEEYDAALNATNTWRLNNDFRRFTADQEFQILKRFDAAATDEEKFKGISNTEVEALISRRVQRGGEDTATVKADVNSKINQFN